VDQPGDYGLPRARFPLDQYGDVVLGGDAQLFDETGQRWRLVDQPATEARGNTLGRRVREGSPGLEAAPAPGGQFLRLGGPQEALGHAGSQLIGEAVVPDLLRFGQRETHGQLLHSRLARHSLGGRDIGRVKNEEKDGTVGLRRCDLGQFLEPDDRRRQLNRSLQMCLESQSLARVRRGQDKASMGVHGRRMC
jgi:hypothetical protein